MQELQSTIQGYQAENHDLKVQLEHLQTNNHDLIERKLSAVNLIDQQSIAIQTEQ